MPVLPQGPAAPALLGADAGVRCALRRPPGSACAALPPPSRLAASLHCTPSAPPTHPPTHPQQNFKGSGLLGQDVVAALRRELAAQGIDALVPAVMNDTVATLVGFMGYIAVSFQASCHSGKQATGTGAWLHTHLRTAGWDCACPSAPPPWHGPSPGPQVALRYSEPDTQLGIIVGTGGLCF